jgi:hypothetical protein
MNSLAISLKKFLKSQETPLERFKNLKKILTAAPQKNLFHVVMILYLLHHAHQWIFKTQQREEIPKEGDNYIGSL